MGLRGHSAGWCSYPSATRQATIAAFTPSGGCFSDVGRCDAAEGTPQLHEGIATASLRNGATDNFEPAHLEPFNDSALLLRSSAIEQYGASDLD